MRSLKFLVMVLCFVLFLAASCLPPPPTQLLAATGTATCPGGISISCSAYRCDCVDNVGCTGYDSSGNVVASQTKACAAESSIAYIRPDHDDSTATKVFIGLPVINIQIGMANGLAVSKVVSPKTGRQ